jgi:hypothetical protein
MAGDGVASYDARAIKEDPLKTRTAICAASFVTLLMSGSFDGAGRSTAHVNNPGNRVERPASVVVATGLDNPRGLDWSHGRLYIAEAGTGGDGSCVPGIFAPEICLGRTGSVTVVTRTGRQRRIVKGLPSLAGPDGTFAYGPSDVSVKDGHVFVSIGGPNDTEYRALISEAIGRKLGTVQLLLGRRSITVRAISEFVARHDPDGPPSETNTNSVLAGRRIVYAIDTASNALFGIDWRGRLELLHVFDDIVLPDGGAIDAVPTNMVFGPDGAVYVSTLTGVPFPEGAAVVWRWDGVRATPYAEGLTAAIDLAFGPDGSLYVVEMRSVIGLSGRVLRIAPNGTRTVVADGLDFPTGVAVGNRVFYVTNHGTSPGIGEVLRFRF